SGRPAVSDDGFKAVDVDIEVLPRLIHRTFSKVSILLEKHSNHSFMRVRVKKVFVKVGNLVSSL
ncbi:hypothetical protein, partial [Prevotella sp. OH937_COT-195]|uniref:hypothetical protein n=1 Tax=Prevotella sp. OH937_COT-195 TaxID=2491051 RepID=UPI001F48E462